MDANEMARSLSTRINMQISVSALPIVEEWMDARLGRWLESVPLPMEFPGGGQAHMEATVAGDLQGVVWSAYGTPNGFIPKLAKYLSESGAEPTDIDLINVIGETFSPREVGSWLRVGPGVLTTGWMFRDEFDAHRLAECIREIKDPTDWLDWASERQLPCIAASGALKNCADGLRLVFGPGEGSHVASLLSTFAPGDHSAVADFFAGSAKKVEMSLGTDTVSISLMEAERSDFEKLSEAAQAPFQDGVWSLQGALGSEGLVRTSYTVVGDKPVVIPELRSWNARDRKQLASPDVHKCSENLVRGRHFAHPRRHRETSNPSVTGHIR